MDTCAASTAIQLISRHSARRQAMRRAMAATLPRSLFLTRGPANSAEVCLTFDDGPHPEHTPRLLDMLRAHKTLATFFVVGMQVARHPNLVRRIAAEGHAIGHHSYCHTDPAATSTAQLMNEVSRTRMLLEDLTGKAARLFRPPHGKLTATKLLRLWLGGQSVVLWNVDPKDFACRSAAELSVQFVRSPLRGGDIVLLHDNVPHASLILPRVIEMAREDRLSFVPVSRWVR